MYLIVVKVRLVLAKTIQECKKLRTKRPWSRETLKVKIFILPRYHAERFHEIVSACADHVCKNYVSATYTIKSGMLFLHVHVALKSNGMSQHGNEVEFKN